MKHKQDDHPKPAGSGMNMGSSIQSHLAQGLTAEKDDDGDETENHSGESAVSTQSSNPLRTDEEIASKAFAETKIKAALQQILEAQEQSPHNGRYVLRGLAFASLCTPFYSYFLWQSIVDSVNDIAKDFGLPISDAWEVILQVVASILAFASFSSDCRSLLPFEEADELFTTFSSPQGIKLLAMILQVIFLLGSYMWSAATEVLPIADWTKNLAVWEANLINLSSLVIMVVLVGTYFYGFGQDALVKHLEALKAFKDDPKKLKELAKRFKEYPSQTFELIKVSLSTVIYRMVQAGFIPKQIFTEVFSINSNELNKITTISTTAMTGLAASLTRIIRIFESVYPNNSEYLTPEEIADRSIFSSDCANDAKALTQAGLMTLINGSLGLFVYTLIPWLENPVAMCVVNFGIPIAVGTLSACQRALHDRQKLKQTNALADPTIKALVAHRKKAAEAAATVSSSEATALLPKKENDKAALSKKITDEIAKTMLTTGNVVEITLTNLLSRIAVLAAYPKWFQGTLSTVGFNLIPNQYLTGALFTGTQIFEGDGAMYQGAMSETTQYIKVKVIYQDIYEKFKAARLQEMVANGERTPCCGSFFKVWPSIFPAYFSTHADYPMEVKLVAAMQHRVSLTAEEMHQIHDFCQNEKSFQVAFDLLTSEEQRQVNTLLGRTHTHVAMPGTTQV